MQQEQMRINKNNFAPLMVEKEKYVD